MDGLDCYTGQPNESVTRRRRTITLSRGLGRNLQFPLNLISTFCTPNTVQSH